MWIGLPAIQAQYGMSQKLADVELTCQPAPYIDQAPADFYQEISRHLILPELAVRLPVTFVFFALAA